MDGSGRKVVLSAVMATIVFLVPGGCGGAMEWIFRFTGRAGWAKMSIVALASFEGEEVLG